MTRPGPSLERKTTLPILTNKLTSNFHCSLQRFYNLQGEKTIILNECYGETEYCHLPKFGYLSIDDRMKVVS